jgi:zinc protease
MARFRIAVAAFSVSFLLSTTALAQTAKPAPVASLVKQVSIPYKEFTLPNGLRVIVHTDRKAPIVAVSVWYGVGSKHEPKGKTGFAHLFEHLMFNGSENAPGDFFEPLQQVGATDFNGTTWFDRTNYFQNVPTGALDLALFLESDRMGHLLGAVTQEKLDNQRGVVQNEKRQSDNQPYGLVNYEVLATLFPEGHPYRHSTIGSMADLDAATLDDVKRWFAEKYGPNNAVLVLAGDIDVKTAQAKVRKWFGDIPRGLEVPKVNAPVPTLPAPVTKAMKDRVATTRLMRMWAVPGLNHKDATALEAAAGVLGGLSSSRLDNALVRQEKIAVGVTASAGIFEDIGIFSVSADVKPGTDAKLVGERLDAIIAEFLKNGPTKDELARIATRTASGRIGGLESVGGFGGKAVSLAEGALYTGNPAFYRQELRELAALTPQAVTAAANNWLKRPVFSLTVEPGDREAYQEASGVAPANAAQVAGPFNYFDAEQGDAPFGPIAAVDRSKFPEIGTLAPLDFPAIERTTLSSGIPVYFARRAAVPKVQVSVSFDAGFAADPKDALGTQSLMLSVMDEGTRTRSSIQIAEESERLGAALSSSATLDRTSFNLSALAANLGPSLALMSDIIRNPAFDPQEVDRVRAQQLARIAAELTQPQGLAARIIPGKLFGPNHPYGIPSSGTGDAEVVKALTPDQLAAFHRRWLRPDTARIFVVGNTTLGALKPVLEANFGAWPSNRMARPTKDFSTPVPVPQPRIYLLDRPNSPQSVIVAGHVLDAKGRDDLVTLRAANEILGGSFLSRLNTDLRETKGWAYGVRSGISGNENQVAFTFQAPVQADRTGDSIRVFQSQLADFLGPKGVTQAELTRTINGNVRELPGSFETSGDVLGGIIGIVNLDRPDDYYETLAQKYQSLTPAEIDATGRAKIDPRKMIYVVVGDAKKVRPQLDGIGLPVEEIAAPTAR